MKYTITPTPLKKFVPVTLTLKLESQEELDAVASLFGSSSVSLMLYNAGLVDVFPVAIKEDLVNLGANCKQL